jgi:anti-sigma factor RsiW
MPKLTVGGQFYSAGEELPDEGLIMAYVDGELDEEGRRYVEDLLSRSESAREIADMMRESAKLLKSAFLEDPSAKMPSIDLPEPPDAPPGQHPAKQIRSSRPMTGAVSTNPRLKRKA